MERNYYEILGVEKTATVAEIRDAYRDIARVYHPDSNFYDEIVEEVLPPEAMSKFKSITSAYNTLTNDEKRSLYNETLPPELTEWDTPDGEAGHDQWVEKKVRTSGVYAMGQFGNVLEKDPKPSEEEEETVILSVNEYAAAERSWLGNICSGLLSIVCRRKP